MFDEALFIIAVYCVIDDAYRQLYPQGIRHRGFAPELSDAEALTMAVVGEYLSLERDKALYGYFRKHYRGWFPGLRERTLFVRQLANLWQAEQMIWQHLVKQSGADEAALQIIDTLPIPVCHLRRYKGRHIFAEDDVLIEPDVGYCASKDWHYFGVKGGIRIAANGMIVHAPLLPSRPHDSQLAEALLAGMPAGAIALGDKGFIDAAEQTLRLQHDDLLLLTPLRQGMQPNPFRMPVTLHGYRSLIETVNAQLVGRFKAQSMRIRKGWTLFAKWFRKILAHTVCVWLNLQFHRPPLDFEGLVSLD